MHSQTAFSLTPGLTEVVLFGGSPETPKDDGGFKHSNTIMLRFGEFLMCACYRAIAVHGNAMELAVILMHTLHRHKHQVAMLLLCYMTAICCQNTNSHPFRLQWHRKGGGRGGQGHPKLQKII